MPPLLRRAGATRFALLACVLLLVPPARAQPSTEAKREALRQEIARHDDLYFRQAAPVISDAAYDELKHELQQLDEAAGVAPPASPEPPVSAGVGATGWAHTEPMLSLQKAYRADQIDAFDLRLRRALGEPTLEYVVEPKIDGVALSLVYEHGELVGAGTRGDGRRGQDLTAFVRGWPEVPSRLQARGPGGQTPTVPRRVELRGEVYLPRDQFTRINEERGAAGEAAFTHPRTVVAATVHQGDSALATERGLRVVMFGVGECVPAGHAPGTQAALYEQLAAWGLPTLPEVQLVRGASALHEALGTIAQMRSSYPFPTDGAVVKLNQRAWQAELGATTDAPRWAVARKFEAERASTVLRDITWQVGRTGLLTPVAELAPVQLGGTTIRRATLHHRGEVLRLDVRPHDVVVIERAGDVIPFLTGVDLSQRPPDAPPYPLPTHCPDCAVELVVRGVDLACPASVCSGRLKRQLEHYVGSRGVQLPGIGPALIARWVDRGTVRRLGDLYRLQPTDFPRDGARLATRIAASRPVPLAALVQGLGLPGLSPAAVRALALRYGTISTWAAAPLEEWTSVAGLRPTAAARLHAYWHDHDVAATVADLINAGVESP